MLASESEGLGNRSRRHMRPAVDVTDMPVKPPEDTGRIAAAVVALIVVLCGLLLSAQVSRSVEFVPAVRFVQSTGSA